MISIKQQRNDPNRFSVALDKPESHWESSRVMTEERIAFKTFPSRAELFGYGKRLADRLAPKTRSGVSDTVKFQQHLQLKAGLYTNAPETPWELLAWGEPRNEHFWAVEQPIVRYPNDTILPAPKVIAGRYPSRLIIVSDPDNQLELATDEHEEMYDSLLCNSEDRILNNPPLDKVKLYLASGYSLIVFIGHATFNAADPEQSQFHLAGGQHLTPQILEDNLDGRSLVIFIACVTAQHEPAGDGLIPMPALGFMPACLRKDVPAFIGPLWEIGVTGGLAFLERLGHLLDDRLPAEALRLAKKEALDEQADDTTWSAFVIYQNQPLLQAENAANESEKPFEEQEGQLPPPLSVTVPDKPASPLPDKIGRYEIKEELGSGGQGIVYLGYDPKLKRQVAIKLLTERASSDLRSRFENEARLIARLEKNPAVLSVYDVDTHAGQPYIVMGYAPRGTLKKRLENGRLPPKETLRIIQQVAKGLDHIHDQDIVHRDLKPANIFFDEDDQVLIGDFGIAKEIDNIKSKTLVGLPIGTAAYMSPEQWIGSKDINKRSDIYSLGIILFELLTGKQPFQGSIETIREQHLKKPVPDLHRYDSNLLKAVNTVVQKATAKSPNKRYAKAGELAKAFNQALIPPPPPSSPPPKENQLWQKAIDQYQDKEFLKALGTLAQLETYLQARRIGSS